VSADPTPVTAPSNSKQDFLAGGFTEFGNLGWSPEGQVYFNYAVNMDTDGALYLASAEADIDNDGTNFQVWGYRKGAQAGKTHPGGASCSAVEPVAARTVAPCTLASGQSVF
jgi:hypothetical protein